uniref:Uncharacterized protein n=1 Tax=Stomoxys calcitrans TaxID=35570 RepID=A0A2Y9D4Q4_STOCA
MKRASVPVSVLPVAVIKAKTSLADKSVDHIKLHQLVGVIALLVTINCLQINYVSASLDQESEDRLATIRKKCIAANSLTEEQSDIIFGHKLFTATTTAATTPKAIQCYCLCYLNESKIFADGKPNEKFIREVIPIMINDKKKAFDAIDKCMNLNGADECEIGFNFELCLIKETGLYVY